MNAISAPKFKSSIPRPKVRKKEPISASTPHKRSHYFAGTWVAAGQSLQKKERGSALLPAHPVEQPRPPRCALPCRSQNSPTTSVTSHDGKQRRPTFDPRPKNVSPCPDSEMARLPARPSLRHIDFSRRKNADHHAGQHSGQHDVAPRIFSLFRESRDAVENLCKTIPQSKCIRTNCPT